MILPTKHLDIDDSLFGGGAVLLQELKHPITVSSLWFKLSNDSRIGNYYRFSMILVFLFALGAIEFSDNLIRRRENAS